MGVPRKIVQIAATSEGAQLYAVLYALADDASVWAKWGARGEWEAIPSLPNADGCAAKCDGDPTPCRLAARHRDRHWNGSRRWT